MREALAAPNRTMQKVEPGAPTLRCAWWMNSATSVVLMPSRRMLAEAFCTSRVIRLARCISASSSADLRIRPWSISGAALTKFLPGACWRKRSNMPNGRARTQCDRAPRPRRAPPGLIEQRAIGILVFLPGVDGAIDHLEVAHRTFLEGRRKVFEGRPRRTVEHPPGVHWGAIARR